VQKAAEFAAQSAAQSAAHAATEAAIRNINAKLDSIEQELDEVKALHAAPQEEATKHGQVVAVSSSEHKAQMDAISDKVDDVIKKLGDKEATVQKATESATKAQIHILNEKVDGIAEKLEQAEAKQSEPSQAAGKLSGGMSPQAAIATLSPEQKAKMQEITDKVDNVIKQLGDKATEQQAAQSATEAQLRSLNATVDGLSKKLDKAVAKHAMPQEEAKDLSAVGKVELLNAKTGVEQAILTAALEGQARIQGKVDAADHSRAAALKGLNTSVQAAMNEARGSLQSAENNVAKTAREAVDGTLADVLQDSVTNVQAVGAAAESLKSEAESLQRNATAIKEQVQSASVLVEEVVAQLPSNSALVEEMVGQIQAEVKEMSQEATEAGNLAARSLEAVEEAQEVLDHSTSKAEEATSLKLRAAQQASLNKQKLLQIRATLTGAK